MSKADEDLKLRILNEVIDVVNEKYPDVNVAIDCGAFVIYGEK